MNKRILSLTLAFMLLCTLMLSGCTKTESPNDSKVPGTDTTNPTDVAAKDRDLIIATVTDVISLDPHVKDSGTEMQISAHLYDGLVNYNTDLSLEPGLAESWKLLDDGITWEFKLRQGVKFQNGNLFNADDVIFSIERILENNTLEMGVYLLRVAELKKVDDFTVQIVTKIPYPVFAGSLKHIMIIDKETCEGLSDEEIAESPNGTGRYKLKEHVKESHIILEQNAEYWGELPAAKTVQFRVISNPATRTAALINGEVDFISKIPVMDVERVKSSQSLQVITSPSLSCNYMGFDHLNEQTSAGTDSPNPLKIIKVRQAIYHAIDIDAIIKTVMNGFATPAMSYMPSICVGFDDKAQRPAYDPDLAKKLLKEAGYENGFNLRVDSRNDGTVNNDQVAQAIASYLEKVGIKTEVNLMPRATFFEKTSATNLQSSFFMAGWGDSSGEGMVILNDMIYTYEGKPGLGEGNKGHYSNAEVDKILDEASVTADKDARAELVKKADAIARDEVACIPLFFAENIFGVRAGLKYTPRADDHIQAWDFEFLD